MKAAKRRRRVFPPVLADDLLKASVELTRLGLSAEERLDLLARFRRGELRHTSSPSLGPADGLTPQGSATPLADVLAIQKYDEAFQRLHRYRREHGARAYLSARVEDEAFSLRQQDFGKARKIDDAPIAAYLVEIGYQSMKTKKRAREEAAKEFGVSETHINTVARENGLLSRRRPKTNR